MAKVDEVGAMERRATQLQDIADFEVVELDDFKPSIFEDAVEAESEVLDLMTPGGGEGMEDRLVDEVGVPRFEEWRGQGPRAGEGRRLGGDGGWGFESRRCGRERRETRLRQGRWQGWCHWGRRWGGCGRGRVSGRAHGGHVASATADGGMVEELLELSGGGGAVFHVAEFRDGHFATVGSTTPEVEKGWCQAQDDPGLQEVAVLPVLKRIEGLLVEVAMDFGSRAGAMDEEGDIIAGGGGRILTDLDPVGSESGGGRRAFRIEEGLQGGDPGGGGLVAGAVEFDVALERVDVEGAEGASPPFRGEVSQAAHAGLGVVRTPRGTDEEVSVRIQAHVVSDALRQGGFVPAGRCWGAGRRLGSVPGVEQSGESFGGAGILRRETFAVEVDGAIGGHMEGLWGFHEAAGHPFVVIDLHPGLSGGKDRGFVACSEHEPAGGALGMEVEAGDDRAVSGMLGRGIHGEAARGKRSSWTMGTYVREWTGDKSAGAKRFRPGKSLVWTRVGTSGEGFRVRGSSRGRRAEASRWGGLRWRMRLSSAGQVG